MNPAVVLSVAGTDSGGAAGLAADLATFAAHGTHGAAVVTAVTAQDTTGVRAVHVPPYDVVVAQVDAVLDDLPVAAVKTGMLGSPEVVRLVAERLGHLPLVVDPVLVATSGAVLGDAAVRAAYVEHLLPVASLITPNVDEAAALLGSDSRADGPADSPADELAAGLAALGPAVVVTGGGTTGRCTDWLAAPGRDPIALSHPALPTTNDHGTGCTFSAALAAHLAHVLGPARGSSRGARGRSGAETRGLLGADLEQAVRRAAAYTANQLMLSRHWDLGRGRGPIAHLISTNSINGRNHEETP
ncbi:bifunctional hydroxymethylpyrimidine kinase/phosphomethylpyrimidine kinase [Nocardioides sp. JQ2195]|uniref:bifunctional hydroxymethylpyrimidine kinase/phosphomethylpyrimidine kinase n=1 Tax=Nocardioides sp. JQ2195 TaxID=2592334 RepID=UPI00143E3DDB|nr:bifunctional hydroxymethylpyrimidine kinase/phosphomethylpyrimidine kinase [Nocardioides sp. JQ2195]QIX27752.1 bifunctional hydroxymethylpyrimidine kinase/phosphomethylpyrimidine kinase [Nocardioides sp. JQ2195]